mmetsp:Transcript_13934/g.36887  ORF Transcript_13934/g.36887 Transcript_13934/m.36887 type:complete len:452 (-) Transcript_13934:243-1598(-)
MAGEPTMAAKVTAEFIGTFLLIFTVGCNVLGGAGVWAGVSIASVLMVSIYALGGISGANFNPAVSVCLAITHLMGGPGDMDAKTAGMYVGTQLVAGLCAGIAYSVLFWDTFNLQPGVGFSLIEAGLAELQYTFMLCFVVLNAAVAKPTQYYGLAIGFVVVAGAYGAGAISGGFFNPAISFGVDGSSVFIGFGWCIVYILFQLVGAALAAVAFKVVRPDQFGVAGPTPIGAKLVSEFLGTYFLVLTIGLNVLAGSKAAFFSIAAAYMSMIYALGDVSGAHFNPAVTVAIAGCGRNKITPAEVGMYIVAQVAGGISAGFSYKAYYHGNSFPLGPVGDSSWGEVSVAESVFTFVLCFVVLSVAISEKTAAPEMFGLAIGSCVTMAGCAIGGISGAALNPAVAAGIAVSHMSGVPNCLFYSLFELAGACMAAGVFHVTHAVDLEGPERKPLRAEA